MRELGRVRPRLAFAVGTLPVASERMGEPMCEPGWNPSHRYGGALPYRLVVNGDVCTGDVPSTTAAQRVVRDAKPVGSRSAESLIDSATVWTGIRIYL